MPEPTVTELLTDINARVTAMGDINARLTVLGEQVSDQRLEQFVSAYFDRLLTDNGDFARKMRFGQEPKLVGSKFSRWNLGKADVEFLYDVMTARGRQGHTGPSEALQNAFKDISEAYYMPEADVQAIDRQAIDNLFPRIPLTWLSDRDRALAQRGAFQDMDAYHRAMRAMDTAETGFGLQLIGAQYVGELWDAARRESRVFSLLDSFEMTAPSAYLPLRSPCSAAGLA